MSAVDWRFNITVFTHQMLQLFDIEFLHLSPKRWISPAVILPVGSLVSASKSTVSESVWTELLHVTWKNSSCLKQISSNASIEIFILFNWIHFLLPFLSDQSDQIFLVGASVTNQLLGETIQVCWVVPCCGIVYRYRGSINTSCWMSCATII